LFMVTFPIEVKPCFCVPRLWCPTVRGSGSFAKTERLRIGAVLTVANSACFDSIIYSGIAFGRM
jgi:hypothetical protein